MGAGGEGRSRRKKPFEKEASRRDGAAAGRQRAGGKGSNGKGRGDGSSGVYDGARGDGPRAEGVRRDRDRGRARHRGRRDERRRKPQESWKGGGGGGKGGKRNGVTEKEAVEEAFDEDDDEENEEEGEEGGLVVEPWKLLDKGKRAIDEDIEAEDDNFEEDEEAAEDDAAPEAEAPKLPPPSARKLPLPPPPPPKKPEAKPTTAATRKPGEPPRVIATRIPVEGGSRKRQQTEQEALEDVGNAKEGASKAEREPDSSLVPQAVLSNLPVEYAEQALEDLHIAADLPEDALLSVEFLPKTDSSADSQSCVATYRDVQSAQQAIEALNGMRVWASDGEYKDLGAVMANPKRRTDSQADAKRLAKKPRPEFPRKAVAAPEPTKVEEHAVRSEPGQPKESGKVKVWFEDRGFGFIVPDTGGADVYVHRSSLADGSYLSVGDEVTFIPVWDAAKSKTLAQECWGAQGEVQEPLVPPSEKLQAFAEQWLLDPGAVHELARMPEEVLNQVMERFQPEEETSKDSDPVESGGSVNIFVAGLPEGAEEELLRAIFEQHGAVEKCKVLENRSNHTNCAGLVEMGSAEEAEVAIAALNQATPPGLEGPLTVRYAANQHDKAKSKGKGKVQGSGPGPNHSKSVVLLARAIKARIDGVPQRTVPTGAKASVANSDGPQEIQLGVMLNGTVKFWKDDKGYGFVIPEGGGPDVLVRRNILQDGTRLLNHSHVTFEAAWDEEGGKYRAVSIVGASDTPADAPPQPRLVSPPQPRLVLPPTEHRPPPPPPLPPPPPAVRSSGPGNLGTANPWIPPPAAPSRATQQGATARGKVKAWFEERGFGFVVLEVGGPDIYVHRTKLVDCNHLVPDTMVQLVIHWDPAKGQYVTEECRGAQPDHKELPSNLPSEVQSFAERWSLDGDAAALVARLPAELQREVIARYEPEEHEGSHGDEQGSTLFVSGLPMDVTEEFIQAVFSEHGEVTRCTVLLSRSSTLRPDRAALVHFATPEEAENAIAALHEAVLDGCENPISVKHASRGKGKGTAVNHSKAVVMLAHSLEAQARLAQAGDGADGAEHSVLEATSAAASSSSAPGGSGEIQCGIMLPGTVKLWNDQKGYGFVNPEGGGPDVFVHRSRLKDGNLLYSGSYVTFMAEWEAGRSRYRALEVLGATDQPQPPPPTEPPPPSLVPERRMPGRPSSASSGGTRPSLPPPPPPVLPSDSGPGRQHVPQPVPPQKRRRLLPQAPSRKTDEPFDDWGPRPPDTPPPSSVALEVALPRPSRVMTARPKVRPSGPPPSVEAPGAYEAEAYPSSAADYEAGGDAEEVEEMWVEGEEVLVDDIAEG